MLSGRQSAKPLLQRFKPSAKPEEGKPGVADQAKKSAEAAKKAGVDAKAGQKALPKTHAAKEFIYLVKYPITETLFQ